MKKIVLLLAVIAFSFSAYEVQAQKTSEKEKQGSQFDSRRDNMAYWMDGAQKGLVEYNPKIQVKPAKYNGSELNIKGVKTFNSPDVAVTDQTDVTESENSIFIDPNDFNYVLNSNNSTSWNGGSVGSLYGANYLQSDDGGLTFDGSVQGAGGNQSGDPTTAIDQNGRQYVGYISSSGGMGVAYSDDGDSWTAKTIYSPGSQDKNHMWVDNNISSPHEGNLYNVWTSFGGFGSNNILFSRSTDDGNTWSAAIDISSAVNAGSHNQGCNVQTGPNGEVYVVWAIYDGWPTDESAIGFAKSTDGGATFETAVRVIENIKGIRTSETSKNHRVNSFPSMAVDISGGSNNGNIYVSWTNIGTPGVNTGQNRSVYMASSADDGTTWSTAVRINQGPFDDGREAYFPWITCDAETGVLAAVFYDDRNVSSSDCEAFSAFSLDAGTTWTDFVVSDVSFTPSAIPGLAGGYMGDYLGITSLGGKVYPCWTDNRGGLYMTYVSAYALSLNAEFTADAEEVCSGSSVTFNDVSTGEPVSWDWSFPGGSPDSFTGQNPPAITYSAVGSYTVSLTVSDGSENDTEVKTDFIEVKDIIAEFSGTPTSVITGNTVTFTNESSCDPNSWEWSFPGGNPNSFTGETPPAIQYDIAGQYDVSLTVTNASGTDTKTKTEYIDVFNCVYCVTSYSNQTDDWISNVTFNTINNATGPDAGGYGDYTDISTSVDPGSTYNISVDITVNGAWTQNTWVWIDWNQNCDFSDPGEAYDLGETPGSQGTFTLTSDIDVPNDALSGVTGMRVAELYNSDPTPCTESTYGEAEGYSVEVGGSQFPAPTNLVGTVEDNDVTLTWDVPVGGTPTNYNVFRENTLIGSTTETTYSEMDLEDGTYNYCVTAVYDEGESASICISVTIGDTPGSFWDDFESGDDKWEFTGDWGLTEEYSYSTSHSLADSPGGNYLPDQETYATMANGVDLSDPGILSSYVTWWMIMDIENGDFDYVYVEASDDDFNTFVELASFFGQDMLDPWLEYSYSLGSFIGSDNVKVRFHFSSDQGFEVDGCYIDDFIITTSDVDEAAPEIFFDVPFAYEANMNNYEVNAVITDVTGVASAEVLYTLEGVAQNNIVGVNTSGDNWQFTIPLDETDAGSQVDFRIEAIDSSPAANVALTDTASFISGVYLGYDNAFVNFFQEVGPDGSGGINATAVKFTIEETSSMVTALIRNYADQSVGLSDEMIVHVWADGGNGPGDDLIDPITMFPEADLVNTNAFTRIDLRPFSDDLGNIPAGTDVYIGFTVTSGVVRTTITQPAIALRSYTSLDGNSWDPVTDDYHYRIILGSPTVGIKDHELNFNTQVYPNPATNAVMVKSDAEINSVKVFNFAGQVIVNDNVSNSKLYQVNTSDFESGIYFFQIETNEGIISERVIIQ